MACLDIYINSSHPRSRSCSASTPDGYTSLIESIQCWLDNGQVVPVAGATDVTFSDNGDGTGTILVDGAPLATFITTATDVALTDNGDGTSTLVVNGTSLGNVINTETPETVTTLVDNNDNTFTYTSEDGTVTTVDLSQYIDDTNLARLVSGTLNPTTGILTVTRDDASTFDVDLSALIDAAVITSVNGMTGAVVLDAGDIAFTPTGNTTSTDVQGAIVELQTEIDNLPSETVTTLVDNGDGTFTYTSEDATVTTFDADKTTVLLTDNGDGTASLIVDGVDLGDVTTQAPHADDDVETVSGTAVDNTDPRNPVINLQDASEVAYDNTTSGLTSTNTQSAINEIDTNVDTNTAAIAANTLLAHDPVTVTDGATIDLTVTGQDLTAEISGVATATAGQVFEADGLGGGTWVTPIDNDTDVTAVTTVIDVNKDLVVNVVENGNTVSSTAVNVAAAWDNPDATPADQTSVDINYTAGNVGLGITNPLYQLDTSEDIQVNGIEIGRGGANLATNTRVGDTALSNASGGGRNVAVGQNAMQSSTTSQQNVAVGQNAMMAITTGGTNVAVGTSAMFTATTANNNVAVGQQSMRDLTTGRLNVAVGRSSLLEATTAQQNVAVGDVALQYNISGLGNTAIGYRAGTYFGGVFNLSNANTGTSNSTYLGRSTTASAVGVVNETAVGNGAIGQGSNTSIIGSVVNTDVYLTGDAHADAYIINSDERLKSDFVDTGLIKLINGNEVSVFSFKYTQNGSKQLGVKAQDVETALAGLSQDVIDIIVRKSEGVDANATLQAINNDFGSNASTLNEAYEVNKDKSVKRSLESNGFPTITPPNAEVEFEELSNKTELTDKEQDRLNRFQNVDFTGVSIIKAFEVVVSDIRIINTTALQWVM